MRKTNLLIGLLFLYTSLWGQDPWKITVSDVRTDNYYGVTVGNGMLGIVSSPEPLRTNNVVLAGSYDKYGRGRVSNFLNGFNMLNGSISIDGNRINRNNISGFTQTLDMKKATFTSHFTYADKADITCSYLALRQLPYCAMMVVEVEPKADITIAAVNTQETPDAFRDGRMFYNEINRRHAAIKLLTTQAQSPTGRLTVCASSAFMFPEKAGEEPRVTHTTHNSNSHQTSFSRKLRKGKHIVSA